MPPPENIQVEGNHFQDIRNIPAGNGQGIRIEGARNVKVVGNTLEHREAEEERAGASRPCAAPVEGCESPHGAHG